MAVARGTGALVQYGSQQELQLGNILFTTIAIVLPSSATTPSVHFWISPFLEKKNEFLLFWFPDVSTIRSCKNIISELMHPSHAIDPSVHFFNYLIWWVLVKDKGLG